MAVSDISSQGRDATGVRLMSLDDGQTVASVAPILASDDEVDGGDGGDEGDAD
jgi:DNA gyrase subunit A